MCNDVPTIANILIYGRKASETNSSSNSNGFGFMVVVRRHGHAENFLDPASLPPDFLDLV